MTLKSSRHGGDVFSLAPSERNKILDFSININPLGLSPLGRRALLRYWEKATLRYPDVEDRDVTASLSAAYGMDKDTIALGNGATELMYTLLRFLKPEKVLVPAPAFSEYRLSAEAAGADTESFLLDQDHGFSLPLGELERKMVPRSLLYLGHPNNPDGCLLSMEDFKKVMALAEDRESYVVIDESFIDFVEGDVSYRSFVKTYSHLVVIMSLTKFYAVPGLRIGCSFAHPALTEKIKDIEPTVAETIPIQHDDVYTYIQQGMIAASVTNMPDKYSLADLGYDVAIKTGTPQAGGGRVQDSFFIGYAPTDNPKIAFACVVEGAEYSKYMIRDVLKAYERMETRQKTNMVKNSTSNP